MVHSKKSLLTILITLAALLLVLVGCSIDKSKQTTKPNNQITVTYQLQNDGKKIAEKKVDTKKNAKVITGLKKAWTVKDKEGMITSIDGHQQDSDKNIFWTYTINNKTIKKGAQEQKVKNNDKVTFNLSKYQDD